jgi:hypothetical protein
MAQQKVYTDLNLLRNQLLLARFQNSNVAPTTPDEGQFYFDTNNKAFLGWNGTAWIDLGAVASSGVTIRGDIANADTSPAFPSNPDVGDTWFVTTVAGTVGGQAVDIGDQLIYTSSGWRIIQANLRSATELIAGFVRMATQAEADAGSSDTIAITPLKLANFLTGKGYVRKAVQVTNLTANTAFTFSHGLGLADQNDLSVSAWQANEQIMLAVRSVSANAVEVESNVTLSNVKLVALA